MDSELNSAMVQQKVILVKAAMNEFMDNFQKGVGFNESLSSGDIVLWRDAERTFKASFTEDTEKDLLIGIIRECKGYYRELVQETFSLFENNVIH
jgi:hypothetical protein